jgi:hypothetical protein
MGRGGRGGEVEAGEVDVDGGAVGREARCGSGR